VAQELVAAGAEWRETSASRADGADLIVLVLVRSGLGEGHVAVTRRYIEERSEKATPDVPGGGNRQRGG
jgi:hypothetical protein